MKPARAAAERVGISSMKSALMRKVTAFGILCIAALAIWAYTGDFPATGPLTMPDYSCETAGVIARFENGAVMLLDETAGPIVLQGDMNFDGLKTGDRVTIYCDGIMETYPAQAIVKEMVLHSSAEKAELPQEMLEQLKAMGYELQR